MEKKYEIAVDPEANVLYQSCRDVDGALWAALVQADPGEVQQRTGAGYQNGVYTLPFLNRELRILPDQKVVEVPGNGHREAEFQLCLVTLLYLVHADAARLPSRQVSPKEYKGGVFFFQGPHALPTARLEERYGFNRELFRLAGRSLGGQEGAQGDAALRLETFPHLAVEVILYEGDDEFPPQVVLTAPAALEHFWALDGIWALLNVVARELWRAAENS